MNWKEQFTMWLETLSRWQDEATYKTLSEEGLPEERLTVQIFTASHVYRIAASPTYLGCTVSSRMPRPGETWTRGNDLADGSFAIETWDRILRDIVGYELKAIEPEREESLTPVV